MSFFKNAKIFSPVGIITSIASGLAFSYLFNKLKKKFLRKKENDKSDQLDNDKKLLKNEDEIALIREQLKRNYEFFGEKGMGLITKSFICVVGIGGVGR